MIRGGCGRSPEDVAFSAWAALLCFVGMAACFLAAAVAR